MSEGNSNQSRAIVNPPIIDPTISYYVRVYNNSGTTILGEYAIIEMGYVHITSNGVTFSYSEDGTQYEVYTYSGKGAFLGVSTGVNADTPGYVYGDTYPMLAFSNVNLYLVSFEEYETVKVEYNGQELGRVTKGSPLTLNCKNKIMKSNIALNRI